MSHVTIHATHLGFRLAVDSKGGILGSSLSILGYVKKFEHRTFDQLYNHWKIVNEYYYFDRDRKTCYFPRFDLENFKAFLDQHGVSYSVEEITPVAGIPVEFYMLPHIEFKNEKQKNCVEFLTNPESGPQRGVALQTGTGKTVAYIMSLQKLAVRSMTTMTSRLEQWVKEIGAYTTIDEDDIYIIQGVGSLTKLFSLIDVKIKPKLILASAKTIRNYLEYGPTYQHLPHPSMMCELLGIGVVGTDEYHEHFYTNYLIGLILNPAISIPITATFVANDPYVKNIFDQFVPKEVQFYGGDYDKFVNVTSYQYTSGGYLINPRNYKSPQGYSQQIFEKFLMGKGRKVLDAMVDDAIIPIIKTHYINLAEKGEKFLFLCSSTKLCDHLEGIFKRVFRDKTVSVFYSGMPTNVLERYDMILSTPGSAGTGRDIKKLRTCLAFESTGSETRNLQFIGRLRGPPQMMNTPEYTYISFTCIPQHVKYHNMRAMLYGPRAKQFRHRSIS